MHGQISQIRDNVIYKTCIIIEFKGVNINNKYNLTLETSHIKDIRCHIAHTIR